MLTLVRHETGLNCDYVIKGKTENEVPRNGAEHVTPIVTIAYGTAIEKYVAL
jgi:hypothetical protein